MKVFVIISVTLVFLSCKSQNLQKEKTTIDLIENEIQINELILKINSKFKFDIKNIADFKNHKDERPCKAISDSLKIEKNFYKADFDNNGYSDLIVSGLYYREFSVLAIMSFGKDNYELKMVPKITFQNCIFVKVNFDKTIPLIDFYHYPERLSSSVNIRYVLLKDELIYKDGDFIEYNRKPQNRIINKIEYETSGCFGSCPVFVLSIFEDKSSNLDAKYYNRKDKNSNELNGFYSSTIDSIKFNQLVSLINYINFQSLDDKYHVQASDNPRAITKVYYADGTKKVINDYGMEGTNGLSILYDLLAELRFNQDWKK